jgi:glycine oxidase
VSDVSHTSSADVAVIGGGVIGLAAAWRLAQRGAAVTLLERGSLGGGASSVAAGMLAPVSEAEYGVSGRRALELGLAAVERWPAFAAELSSVAGLPVGLRRTGTLILARDGDEAEALAREHRFRDSLGLVTTRLRASEARALEPALAPTLRLALEIPDDHSVDPREVLVALRRAAEQAGVRVREGVAVSGLSLDPAGGRVRGLQLAGGEQLACDRVVAATGAWTSALGGIPEPLRVPVRPLKGQTLRLRDPAGPGLLRRVVRYPGGYLVPRDDGRYVLGATMEERGYDVTATAGGVYELLRHAHELVPGVTELVIEEIAVGLRPGTPDNLPAIGPGALDGLVWAVGHHRNGILLAPLTADLVTAAVLGEPAGELARACARRRLERVPA